MKTKKKETIKEKLARIKVEKQQKKASPKAERKAKKSERGRPSGVAYAVKKEYQEQLTDLRQKISDNLDEAKANLAKFQEKGNKTAAMESRKSLMEIGKLSKELRAVIQEAKGNLKKEKAA